MTKFLTNIDMVQNEIKNFKIDSLGTAPLSPVEGQMYLNITNFTVYVFLNGAWKDISSPDVTQAQLAKVNIGDSGAKLVGVSSITGITGSNVQVILENLKTYVDSVKQSLDIKDSVRVATTINEQDIDIDNAPLQIDGITLAVGDRVLVKNNAYSSIGGQSSINSSAIRNGIYSVSTVGAGVTLTRATDADASEKITAGTYVFVSEGTLNADSGYTLSTNDVITLETTPLSFVQFSGAGQIIAGNGLTKNGNQLDVVGTAGRIVVGVDNVDIDPTYQGQTSINTVGTITTGTWNGTAPDVSHGGTGAITAKDARTNLGATTKFSGDIGDGSATSISVTHQLGTQDVTVMVRENASPFNVVNADVQITDIDNVTIIFATAPTTNQYKVIIVG